MINSKVPKRDIHIRMNDVNGTGVIQAGYYNINNRWRPKADVTKEAIEAVRDLLIMTKPPEEKMNGVQFIDRQNKRVFKLFLAEYPLEEDQK